MQPSDTISYWLSYTLRYVGSAFFEVLRAHCVERGKPYVVTPPQWAVLAFVSESGGQTIGTLAQKLGVEAPAITGIVTRLEQSGLVERVHDREDRRVVKVSLTAEGQDIVRSLDPVVAAFNERLLPGDQRQALLEQLQHLIARVSEVMPDMGNRLGLLSEYLRQKEHECKS
jgi:DNA-binding MarR family transcriptional regulator